MPARLRSCAVSAISSCVFVPDFGLNGESVTACLQSVTRVPAAGTTAAARLSSNENRQRSVPLRDGLLHFGPRENDVSRRLTGARTKDEETAHDGRVGGRAAIRRESNGVIHAARLTPSQKTDLERR